MTDPRFRGLHFPPFIIVAEPTEVPAALKENPALDAGEIAAIALAIDRRISTVLMDEKAGRAAAVSFGLSVSGLLGLLIAAKRRGLVAEVQPLLDGLIAGARFWIGDSLRLRVLRLAGEAS